MLNTHKRGTRSYGMFFIRLCHIKWLIFYKRAAAKQHSYSLYYLFIVQFFYNYLKVIYQRYCIMSEIKFGERIRTVRKNAGCSQKEFCSLLDIPQSTLSAYETDRMQPTVATLINIATRFNVSMDWLWTTSEYNQNHA